MTCYPNTWLRTWQEWKTVLKSRWWFQKLFTFTLTWGNNLILIYTNIFQMGWFNHQQTDSLLWLDLGIIQLSNLPKSASWPGSVWRRPTVSRSRFSARSKKPWRVAMKQPFERPGFAWFTSCEKKSLFDCWKRSTKKRWNSQTRTVDGWNLAPVDR